MSRDGGNKKGTSLFTDNRQTRPPKSAKGEFGIINDDQQTYQAAAGQQREVPPLDFTNLHKALESEQLPTPETYRDKTFNVEQEQVIYCECEDSTFKCKKAPRELLVDPQFTSPQTLIQFAFIHGIYNNKKTCL